MPPPIPTSTEVAAGDVERDPEQSHGFSNFGRGGTSTSDRAGRSSLRSWVRGEPLHVPSHALVVHFPAALLPTSLLLDIVVRVDPPLGLARAATLLLALGLAGGGVAAATGLLDWVEMLPGPRRTRVTRHLLVQASAMIAFAISLAARVGEVGLPAPGLSFLASAVGFGLVVVGDHLGGLLVYRDGMRVRTGNR